MAMTPRPSVEEKATQQTMVSAKIRMVMYSAMRIGPIIDTCARSLLTARDMSVVSGLKVKINKAATIGRRAMNMGKAYLAQSI